MNTLGRKAFHFSGIAIPLFYLLTNRRAALILAVILFGLTVIIEFVRIRGSFVFRMTEGLIKDKERTKPSGTFYYLLSALLTILFFPTYAAVPGLVVLSVADPLCSLLGQRFGRVRLCFGKSLEGSLTFFLATFLILLAFSFSLPVAAIVACVACLTELFTPRALDDNLSIPLVTALALTLLA